MSRAGIRLQSRFRRSFRACPHGVGNSWGSASLHPRLPWKSLFQDHPKGVWRITQFRPIKGKLEVNSQKVNPRA